MSCTSARCDAGYLCIACRAIARGKHLQTCECCGEDARCEAVEGRLDGKQAYVRACHACRVKARCSGRFLHTLFSAKQARIAVEPK